MGNRLPWDGCGSRYNGATGRQLRYGTFRTTYVEAEDEERRAANRWFRTICEVRSVPVMALGGRFTPERLHANRSGFAMSPRQAAALVASAIANRVMLEPGAVLPRLLSVDGVAMAVENGVGRDMLSSGMVRVAAPTVGAQTLELTATGFRFVVSSIGRGLLEDTGVLLPVLA